MKTFIYTLVLFAVLVYSGFSQPVISYITPDIVTPDYNTYFEIIGPFDKINNFGNDGFSLNNPDSDVSIVLVDPEDSALIVFGPLVVSWQGRMISGQMFVKPGVNPKQWDWELLEDKYRIAIQVKVNGALSNVDSVYIVLPQPLFDISGINESVLGEGQLGKRSRRGAMIFDSLLLADKEYRISTKDCDPQTDGNQGYLPATIIAKGKIIGTSNTLINVSGGFPRVQDAGPGGGGGGGRFYDASPLNLNSNGDDGGNGFISGGPGGRNNSGLDWLGATNAFKSFGMSSFKDGKSLNGNTPPPEGQYEAAGGGTGHPFGKSGEPCWDGNSSSPLGGNGGGSGSTQKQDGGSAGYAVDGQGPKNSKGFAYGNLFLIPFSGGSGGASGNPQNTGTYSGNGGGGGGALSISASKLEGIDLKANGANGGNGDDADGGSGSGGSINMGSKLSASNIDLEVNGGKKGSYSASYGRLRIDATSVQGVSVLTTNAAPFNGFTTDTTQLVQRKFTLRGIKPFQKKLYIYIKPESQNWEIFDTISTDPSSWEKTMDLSKYKDTLFYLVAAYQVENPSTTAYQFKPSYVFSQVAANILKIDKVPAMVCPKPIEDRVFRCAGFPINYKKWIHSVGEENLLVEFQNSKFKLGDQGFELTQPKGFKIVQPGDSVEFTVTFNLPNMYTTFYQDTLLLYHNAPGSPNPFPLVYSMTIDTLLLTVQDPANVQPITIDYQGLDTLDIGKVCINENLSKVFLLQNYSSASINLSKISAENSKFSIDYANSLMDYQEPNNTQNITINLLDNSKSGFVYDKMIVEFQECPATKKTFILKAFVEKIDFQILGNTNFGNVNIGISKTEMLKIVNTGNTDAVINDISELFLENNNEFKIKSINPALPIVLKPFVDTIFVEIEFTPINSGVVTDKINVYPKVKCNYEEKFDITGRGVNSKLYLSRSEIDFGLDSKCADKEETFYIKNLEDATSDLKILSRATILGTDKDNFVISIEPAIIPLTLKPGDSAEYEVRYTAIEGIEGFKNAYIEITTDDLNIPTVRVDLKAEREDLHLLINPNDTLNLGDIYAGFDYNANFILSNLGRLDQNVNDVKINSPSVSVFPYGGRLEANSLNNIDFKFVINEKNEGNQEYIVQFLFNDPCRDTAYAVIKVNSIHSKYTIPDSLNFGILSPCESKIDSIKIQNLSKAPFIIKSISAVQGLNADLFSIGQTIKNLPDTLFENDSETLIFDFNPINSDDGIKQAYIDIEIYINGNTETKRVYLIGERKSGFLITPNFLDFGDVIINTSKELSLTLQNNGIWDISNIKVIPPKYYPTNYIISSVSFTQLIPNETENVQISFTPTALIDYPDSIAITFNVLSCPTDTIWIQLDGKGVPAKVVTIRLPEISTLPTNSDIEIPIYGVLDKPTDVLTGFNIDNLELNFNRTLLYVNSIEDVNTTATFTQKLNVDERIININLRNINLSGTESVLAIIKGSVLLGDTNSTLLWLTKADYTQIDLVSEIKLISGGLSYPYCDNGGNRFLNFQRDFSAGIVSPNPSDGNITIDLQLLEVGNYKLILFDELGKSEKVDEFYMSDSSEMKYTNKFNFTNLNSGIYRLLLLTPSESYTIPIMIVK